MIGPFRPRKRLLAATAILVFVFWCLSTDDVFSLFSLGPLSRYSQDRKSKPAWPEMPDHYPVANPRPLPTGRPQTAIPKIQKSPPPQEDSEQRRVRLVRQAAVKESFQHSWKGYKDFAWLQDEVAPLSRQSKNTFGGWAATLVDALDTLWIMGLKDDFIMAVEACEKIDFIYSRAAFINVFETTIRYLGGFLAAYEISEKKYPSLLAKAVEVGDLLMCAFDTPNRMPVSRWDWQR